ncbi:MAG TPA: efflux RND transporter permease subunit [Pirellulales bacterium]|jgi:Cu/Ag efflux pump CusA|nr:efflux RND transporter permease subunit [Pirellulales bacterium]
MLSHLVAFSLRYRIVVLLLAVMLMVGGIAAVRQSPWDVFPEFAPPQITVQTVAPGLSTEQVEQLVTVPVEAAVGGVHRLKLLRSSSAPGLSVATIIFEDGTDILDARQLVSERLTEVTAYLPRGVEPPRMMPLAASTSRFLMVGLHADTTSLFDLRTLADWTLRRRLQAVPGVAHVEVFGGNVKQYQCSCVLRHCGNTTSRWRTWSQRRAGLPASAAPVSSKPPTSAFRCANTLGSNRQTTSPPYRSHSNRTRISR